jgi:hypothetical protein
MSRSQPRTRHVPALEGRSANVCLWHKLAPLLGGTFRGQHPRQFGTFLTQSGPRTEHHSITSSARARSDSGMVRPRALAVLRLITSSNLVGCSTGRSAGLAPLRILST